MVPKRVLLVEDEQIVARDLQTVLRRLGYATVGIACTGLDAIQLAAETLPDLILMDVRLRGGMDGIEAARSIVKSQPIPIIYLTGYPSTFMSDSRGMVSPFLCVAKPVSVTNLQAVVETALALTPASNLRVN